MLNEKKSKHKIIYIYIYVYDLKCNNWLERKLDLRIGLFLGGD